jgi:hypothetical protein
MHRQGSVDSSASDECMDVGRSREGSQVAICANWIAIVRPRAGKLLDFQLQFLRLKSRRDAAPCNL